MINCLISDCAGRHTTHVPAGGAAKRFILFNNKSKTNVAFLCCLPAWGPCAGAGQWHLAGTRFPARREQVPDVPYLPGTPGWELGGGEGVGMEGGREGTRLLRNATQFTQELCVACHSLGKNRTGNQGTPSPAIAPTPPR